MTRRGAITVLTLMVAAMTNKLVAQETTSTVKMSTLKPNAIGPVKFDLRGFESYTFTLDGDSVTVTPEQIMAALR